jgi:hypothetical protein
MEGTDGQLHQQPAGSEITQDAGQRITRLDLGIAVGSHDPESAAAGAAHTVASSQEDEHLQRAVSRPLQIVQDEQRAERPCIDLAIDPLQVSGDVLEQQAALPLLADRRTRLRRVRQSVKQARQPGEAGQCGHAPDRG